MVLWSLRRKKNAAVLYFNFVSTLERAVVETTPLFVRSSPTGFSFRGSVDPNRWKREPWKKKMVVYSHPTEYFLLGLMILYVGYFLASDHPPQPCSRPHSLTNSTTWNGERYQQSSTISFFSLNTWPGG